MVKVSVKELINRSNIWLKEDYKGLNNGGSDVFNQLMDLLYKYFDKHNDKELLATLGAVCMDVGLYDVIPANDALNDFKAIEQFGDRLNGSEFVDSPKPLESMPELVTTK